VNVGAIAFLLDQKTRVERMAGLCIAQHTYKTESIYCWILLHISVPTTFLANSNAEKNCEMWLHSYTNNEINVIG